MLMRLLAGLTLAVAMTGVAAAEDLALSGNDRWVAVASRQDLTEAISIANTYSAQRPRVVRAQNGWFAVILGPFTTTDLTSFQHDHGGPPLPPDAMLTRGTSYVETMWPASGAVGPSQQQLYRQLLASRANCMWETGDALRNLSVDDCPQPARQPPATTPTVVETPQSAPQPPASMPTVVETPQPPASAGGATIKVEKTTDKNGQEVTFISVEGELALGDEKRFADAAIGLSDAIVGLNSPGGNMLAGIEIGQAIRLKGFRTLVPQGFQCASACAFAWLGGTPRLMGQGATVGFHAMFTTENGQNTVSSAGNAVVGAYLSQLGLSMQAITYITEKQPNDIQWLSFDDAAQLGIEVSKFPAG
jgi:hypothetical protein